MHLPHCPCNNLGFRLVDLGCRLSACRALLSRVHLRWDQRLCCIVIACPLLCLATASSTLSLLGKTGQEIALQAARYRLSAGHASHGSPAVCAWAYTASLMLAQQSAHCATVLPGQLAIVLRCCWHGGFSRPPHNHELMVTIFKNTCVHVGDSRLGSRGGRSHNQLPLLIDALLLLHACIGWSVTHSGLCSCSNYHYSTFNIQGRLMRP